MTYTKALYGSTDGDDQLTIELDCIGILNYSLANKNVRFDKLWQNPA